MQDFIGSDLRDKLKNPLIFQVSADKSSGPAAFGKGYDATVLIDGYLKRFYHHPDRAVILWLLPISCVDTLNLFVVVIRHALQRVQNHFEAIV